MIQKLLNGDGQAWNDFVRQYAGVIHAAVGWTLARYGQRDEDLAADLTQEVFVKLIKSDYRLLRQYDVERATIQSYLAVVARSSTLDTLKKRRLVTTALNEDRAAPAPVLPGDATAAEILDGLPAGLLPERQELIVRLYYAEHCAVREIAEMLGITEQTVRSLRHKALQKMRRYYNDESKGP